jgi:hypothetical protein
MAVLPVARPLASGLAELVVATDTRPMMLAAASKYGTFLIV